MPDEIVPSNSNPRQLSAIDRCAIARDHMNTPTETACVSFIHDGLPTSQFVVPVPGMTKAQALAEALRLAEGYLRDNPLGGSDATTEVRA